MGENWQRRNLWTRVRSLLGIDKEWASMKFDSQRLNRHSIRLKEYDYSSPGAYFVTLVVDHRVCSFGKIEDGWVILSGVGKIARKFWLEIPGHFDIVRLDEFVVMPNHFHGVIWLIEPNSLDEKVPVRGVQLNAPTNINLSDKGYYSKISPKRNSLSVVIRTYKGAVTRWCVQNGHPHFKWERNYFEHIVRNEDELNRIRQYVIDNPKNWESNCDDSIEPLDE